MRNNFYSFSDAFREANRKQKIEYFTSEQEQAQLTATRRQFRSFLIALDIEYGLLKDPEEECAFWHNIAQNSRSSVLNFLDIGTLFKNDVQNLPRQLSSKEEEDLVYLNNMLCHYYELFQQKWSRRIEKMLQERRRQAENVKLSQGAECLVGEISAKLVAADNSTQYSDLDLKSQKQQDTSETQLLEWLFDLGTHLANSDDVPPIPRTVSSQELYDSLFGAMDAKEDKALLGEVNTELP